MIRTPLKIFDKTFCLFYKKKDGHAGRFLEVSMPKERKSDVRFSNNSGYWRSAETTIEGSRVRVDLDRPGRVIDRSGYQVDRRTAWKAIRKVMRHLLDD